MGLFSFFASVDRSTLPEGTYKEVGTVVRQVIEIDIIKVVREYQAQVLEDGNGNWCFISRCGRCFMPF